MPETPPPQADPATDPPEAFLLPPERAERLTALPEEATGGVVDR